MLLLFRKDNKCYNGGDTMTDSRIRGTFFYRKGPGKSLKVKEVVMHWFRYQFRAIFYIALDYDMKAMSTVTYWPSGYDRVNLCMERSKEIFLVPSGDPVWDSEAEHYLRLLCDRYDKKLRILWEEV